MATTRARAWRSSGKVLRFTAMTILLLSVCLALACGGEPQAGGSDGQIAPPPSGSGTAETLTDLQTLARQALAARLSVSEDALTLVSDEAVQWADASLGCPEAGMAYAQVITPGHRITFSHQGDHYEVHTGGGDAGSQVTLVSCEGGISY